MLLCFTYILYKLNMGFLKFNKPSTNQSHIIYTDNVRRKSSFSILVSSVENANGVLGDLSKHIQTFEDNADSTEAPAKFITEDSGSVLVVTELGPNFVFQDDKEEERRDIQTDTVHKWVVFASSFFMMVLVNGFVYSFGTLFPAILEAYKENRATTAAIQSIFTAIGLSSGIFTGAIAQRFGPRKCGLFGAITYSAGLLISSFATSTTYLQISYGVISASGFSFLFICTNQILSMLFEGHTRLICISMVTCGSGLGGIFYPYFMVWLNDNFGLNRTFLILGGIMLNTIPLTFLWHKHPRAVNKSSNIKSSSRLSTSSVTQIEVSETATESSIAQCKNSTMQSNSVTDSQESFAKPPSSFKMSYESSASPSDTSAPLSNSTKSPDQSSVLPSYCSTTPSDSSETISQSSSEATPDSSAAVSESSPKQSKKNIFQALLQTVSYKPFIFLSLGIGFSLATVQAFNLLVMDILESNGLSITESLNAVIVNNAASIPGRLMPGLLQRIPGYSSVMTPILAALLGGVGMMMVNFIFTFTGNAIACGLIGIARGCLVGSMAVATLKVVGIERYSLGLGITSGAVGLTTTLMGPLNGSLRDISGSYQLPLYIATGALLSGAVMGFISLMLHSRVKAKRKRERSMSVFTVTRF